MCVCAQLCPTLCNPLNCNLPGFSVHGISQTRILEWNTISSSRGSSRARHLNQHIFESPASAARFFTPAPPREPRILKYFTSKEKTTFPQSSFTVPPCSTNCLLDQMISRTSSCCSALQVTWDLWNLGS